jgi:acyl phosphate:glycerol-3-phosphate acyltransferase
MIKYIALPVLAYLLGSIPWGLILTRLFTPVDIRHAGSGNIGATNVAREAGVTLGIITLAGDILKGAVPVWLATSITAANNTWGAFFVALVSLAAFMGHLYPVYMKFKTGGKGVATAAGCFAVISPVAMVISIMVFIMMICWFNRVSLASLVAAAVLPVAVWEATHSQIITGCAVITTIFIYFRHTDNIKRLLTGTEPVFWK